MQANHDPDEVMDADKSASIEYHIEPLPMAIFESFAAAEAVLNAWNLDHGLDVTRAQNKQQNKVIWQRDYNCDRYGFIKNTRGLSDDQRVRVNRGSMKIGCLMRIRLEAVSIDNTDGSWRVIHTNSLKHNHPPSDDIRVHPGHRRRYLKQHTVGSMTVKESISAQSAAGVVPREVMATLHYCDPDTLILPEDIANAKHAETRRTGDAEINRGPIQEAD
jgi:hypothetical protein